MKKRPPCRNLLILLSLICLVNFPANAMAGQYERLMPLLINLNGWQAEVPEGLDTAAGDTKTVQAMREYAKGQKTLKAVLTVGNALVGQGQVPPSSAEAEAVEAKTQAMNGFQVVQRHTRKDNFGTVMVLLGGSNQKGAQFVVQYAGLRAAEALSWAKKFDWRKMQQVAAKIR